MAQAEEPAGVSEYWDRVLTDLVVYTREVPLHLVAVVLVVVLDQQSLAGLMEEEVEAEVPSVLSGPVTIDNSPQPERQMNKG